MLKQQIAAPGLTAGWGLRGRLFLPVFIRLLVCSPFVASGFAKLLDFAGATIEVRELVGVEPASVLAALTIIVQLGGSVLLIAGGRLAMAGALVLAGFTLAATLLAHAFWLKTGPMVVADANTFFEHVGLIVGLLLAGGLVPARDRA